MKRKTPTRIIEIRLYKSKKNPKFAHAVASIHPCGHRQYLGITRTPKVMRNYHSLLVNSVQIWTPTHYDVTDKQYCQECPSDLIWIKDLPKISNIEDKDDGLDDD